MTARVGIFCWSAQSATRRSKPVFGHFEKLNWTWRDKSRAGFLFRRYRTVYDRANIRNEFTGMDIFVRAAYARF